MKNYYLVLEIDSSATIEQIKKAYRLKAIKYHPDKHFSDDYLTQKFIEVKEAYEVLSNADKRKEYDLIFEEIFKAERPEWKKETEKEDVHEKEQYVYHPKKPFFTTADRINNATPQYPPVINHTGERIDKYADFFVLPKNIGKLISGFTTLKKDEQPPRFKDKLLRFTKAGTIAILISLAIIFIFRVQNPIWITLWAIVPISIALWLANRMNLFSGTCNYVGINGFATIEFEGTRNNITSSLEFNFNQITDLLIAVGGITKEHSTFHFFWLNKESVLYRTEAIQFKEDVENNWHFDFLMAAQKFWTVYLLDKMEQELSNKGYIEFSIYSVKDDTYFTKLPIYRMGIGYISMVSKTDSLTLQSGDIKRAHYENDELLSIEHHNYVGKKLFKKKQGDRIVVPVTNLSNRLFFMHAWELLIGVDIESKK